MRIYHNSRIKEYREPFGAAETGSEIRLAVDVYECDIERVMLELRRDDEEQLSVSQMNSSESGSYYVSFRAPEQGCLLWYRFAVVFRQDGGLHTAYYGNNSENTGGEGRLGYEGEISPFQITVYKPSEVPEWYKNGIVYQIFPDRFARDEAWRERCERANAHINARRSDIKRVVQEDWTQPAYYVRDDKGRVAEWPVYGGSLKGIEEKLDYLRSLGVTAIYLNPVFEATSNHRYDTADYMHIDPALGTDEDFASLAASAKERGIRLILDGVFSHTGADSIYFDRFGNYSSPRAGFTEADSREQTGKGAYHNGDSPYRSWFRFDESEACGYKSWWGVDDLPEVDENDKGYREFILGEDGAVAHWLGMGASGWRLDVADELPDSFIEETRRRIRSAAGDGLLIGEVWEDASNKISYGERRRYLLGDELDGTMNYPLRSILLDYVNYTIGSGRAADMLMSLAENYPKENFYAALNLIGSHDRERVITAMAAKEDYDSAVRKVKLLSTLQFMLPGVPCIYYGDEVGLTGGVDPENRNGYPWGFENLDLGYHYRMLGLIYDEHPLLRQGDFRMLSGTGGLSDDVFAFTRTGRDAAGDEETILILANRSYGDTSVDLSSFGGLRGGYALELMTSEEMPVDYEKGLGTLKMDRLSAKIISIRREKPETEGMERSAGVICHISSLGTPVLGKPARDFVDYLADAGFGIWQVLPLNPAGMGGSPYSSYAAFAGDPRFINRDELPDDSGYESFVRDNGYWLKKYAAYCVIKEANGMKPWYEWPEDLIFMSAEEALAGMDEERRNRAEELCREQYRFHAQWKDLRSYANSKGVKIMGDLPMFMAADSADVWANKSIFRMDEFGKQRAHAGVPPDAFSGEGQDWGNPLYDWDELKRTGYDWWMKRIHQCAERFDILRIDHFRGLSEYYAIPEGGEPEDGCWQHSAGLGFIKAVHRMLKAEGLEMQLLAEDLGFIDAGVKNLMKLSGLPGMDIWQFTAHEMRELCVKEPEKAAKRAFYTGTHDNDTLVGYLTAQRKTAEDAGRTDPSGNDHADAEGENEADRSHAESDEEKRLRTETEAEALGVIKKIYESPAVLAMLQLQDVFLLGGDSRMNVPGVADGNWKWRMPGASVSEAFPDADERAAWFRELAEKTGRKR